MCIGFSAVWSGRSKKLYTVSGVNSHTEIKELCEIRDTNIELGMLVDLEAWPTGELTDVTSIKNWEIVLDHNGVNPDWWKEQREIAETKLHKFCIKEIKKINETGKYNGYLNLHGTKVTSLGNLQQCGNLDLQYSKVTNLGKLQQCGYLDLQGTKVTDSEIKKLKKHGTIYR